MSYGTRNMYFAFVCMYKHGSQESKIFNSIFFYDDVYFSYFSLLLIAVHLIMVDWQ